jgi:apolipoprotein N-acyltransferase
MYLNLFAFTVIWILGGLTSFIPWTKTTGNPISVALVQGNIPQTIKWSPEHLQLSLDRYVELTQPLWGKYDIIIWPESALPIPLHYIEPFIEELNEKAKKSGSTLILGLPVRTPDESGYFNSVITLGKNNMAYSKRQLVPFGEYIPFRRYLSNTFHLLNIPMPEMVSGLYNQQPLVIGDTRILASICYEIAFPELTRSPDKTINMLLVITNDAWFGDSSAEPQHLQMAAMRALEFRKPVLFASNDGITAIISPDGRIETAIPQRQANVLTSKVQPMYGLTPWLVNGPAPILFILICFIYAGVQSNKKFMAQINNQIATPAKPIENE